MRAVEPLRAGGSGVAACTEQLLVHFTTPPQNKCSMICEFCNLGVCSVECWDDLQFGK